jgi:ATP-dependent Clp protease ATP-binding subunit ClpA
MQQSQEMQAVHQQLQETIQTLHRKAVDADQILDNLQRDQKGKFAAVFADDSGFKNGPNSVSQKLRQTKKHDPTKPKPAQNNNQPNSTTTSKSCDFPQFKPLQQDSWICDVNGPANELPYIQKT